MVVKLASALEEPNKTRHLKCSSGEAGREKKKSEIPQAFSSCSHKERGYDLSSTSERASSKGFRRSGERVCITNSATVWKVWCSAVCASANQWARFSRPATKGISITIGSILKLRRSPVPFIFGFARLKTILLARHTLDHVPPDCLAMCKSAPATYTCQYVLPYNILRPQGELHGLSFPEGFGF